MKPAQLFVFVMLIGLASCGSKDKSSPDLTTGVQAVLAAGSYSVPCFLNKPASQGMGQQIYSKAVITLLGDGTGSNAFELYDDAGCTNLLGSGTVAVEAWENSEVAGVNLLKMVQNDGSGPLDIWIPYASVGGNFYVDVDFTDGESGPYLAEPTALELVEFSADPSVEGFPMQVL